MGKAKPKPLVFEGPFMGLNTAHAPGQLGAGYAVRADNVILSNGRIQPRPPLTYLGSRTNPSRIDPTGDWAIIGLYVWQRFNDEFPETFIVAANDADPYNNQARLFRGLSHELWQGPTGSTLPDAHFQVADKWLYVFVGDVALKTGLTPTDPYAVFRVTLMPPTVTTAPTPPAPLYFAGLQTLAGAPGGLFEYAVTLYRPDDGAESNPTYIGLQEVPAGQALRFVFFQGGWLPDSLDGQVHVRLYRKNVGAGYPFYRLLWSRGGGDQEGVAYTFNDNFTEEMIQLSTIETGPWAPSRNFAPPSPTVPAWHQQRMFYVDGNHPGRIWYSDVGQPGHVGADAYIDVSDGPAHQVWDIASFGGRLLIGAADGIHALSGPLEAGTNETEATGATPPLSQHSVIRTRSSVGPTAPGGFVEAGTPSRMYFAHDSGFFVFNGDESLPVSDLIGPTWQQFVRQGGGYDMGLRVSYAVDPFNQLLFICRRRTTWSSTQSDVPGPELLVYHYGIRDAYRAGGWTTLSLAERETLFGVADSQINVIFGPAQRDDDLLPGSNFNQASMVVGTDAGYVLVTDNDESSFPAPQWEWVSGRISLGKGLHTHVHHIEFYYADPELSLAGPNLYNEFGYRMDGKASTEEVREVNVGDGQEFEMHVGARVKDVQIVMKKGPTAADGWSPELGVLGYGIDAELSGQR